MKKTTFQLLAVFFLFITGCSQEEIVPDPNENNVLKRGGSTGSTEIIFECTHISNDNFIDLAPGYMISVRKILKQGLFSGTINGIGIINSRQSKCEITSYELLPNDHLYDPFSEANRLQYLTYPNEEKMYKIIIEGKILITQQDFCSIRIEGNIYPVCYLPLTSSERGNFEGTALIYSGSRKLATLNDKKFRVYSERVYFDLGNHNIGEYYLTITDKLAIN